MPQPDVMWVAAGSRCVIDKKRLIGPPDLIIEILSPSTEANDRSDKYTLYERHSVREYWIVNPEHRFIEVYTHDGSGFARRGVFIAGQNETFESRYWKACAPCADMA